ncbi:translation elongation factor 4 [Rhizobium sp. FY34]|uniref:translation elongation factor 4 n=1 Tax=Rhizobium sp. FY34 TaxID=2562309 RepID=UPI0010BFE2FB|nr:translation elongation factor 4 [Rhizobium sp. FY34]
MSLARIRNFCIIAHIDHGKSTLADRFIEITQTVANRDMQDQLLDSMDIERERGITVKLRTVRMQHRAADGVDYQFNLIDTPGHVDFSAEVSRSLATCEGAIVLIDATQGVQAQTIANVRLAREQGLKLLAVLNKIDSPLADPQRIIRQLYDVEGLDPETVMLVSARTGDGVRAVLDAVAEHVPPPESQQDRLRALVFDSYYDPYRGVVLSVRVVDGTLSAGDRIRFMSAPSGFEATEVGIFRPELARWDRLSAGEVGYVATGIKDPSFIRLGDTLTLVDRPAQEPIARYSEPKPMVFAGLYPSGDMTINTLRDAVQKLALNDAAFRAEAEVSEALGAGYRCGFLGMLHLDIVKERLKREYGVEVITTAPSVVYRVTLKNGDVLSIDNPAHFPNPEMIEIAEEPMVASLIQTPSDYIGAVMELCGRSRGIFGTLDYGDDGYARIAYDLPMSQMAFGFFDSLKSLTQGYATLDYEFSDYQPADLVRVDILIENQPVDAFAFVSVREQSYEKSADIVRRLKYVMPKKLYPVPLQAAIGSRVIAREDIPPLRKDALAKGFDGSMSAKNRLIRKSKENKGKRHGLSRGDIPQEAFLAILAV